MAAHFSAVIKSDSGSHAVLDEESRIWKAKKIAALSAVSPQEGAAMLEVGTGSGHIAAYFSRLGYGEEGAFAVDIKDERQVKTGFQFRRVANVQLPFRDERFDFIISNHVIEHVGDELAQRRHLSEINRCLAEKGVFYLAVPNRWTLLEPHYRLPFLSWPSRRLADLYLKASGKADAYDCRPLSRRKALEMLAEAGFEAEDATLRAIGVTIDIEQRAFPLSLVGAVPVWVWRPLRVIMPTLIFVCRKTGAPRHAQDG